MKIYVAGPYSTGDPIINTREAVKAAEELIKKGHIPFIPHLTMLWHLIAPHPTLFWYEYDFVWLRFCNAVLRLPGISEGADGEVKLAKHLCMPIYYDISEVPEGVQNGER
jgi:hypothetical protein